MFLRRIDDQTASNTQEAMDRLTVPRQEGTTVKKEGKQGTIVLLLFDILARYTLSY